MSYDGTGLSAGPKVPVAIKKANGTYREDRDGGKITVPVLDSVPLPPDDFTDPQKNVWNTVVHSLFSMGVLHAVGIEPIKIYCIELKRYYDACALIDELGLIIEETETKGMKQVNQTVNTKMKKNPAIDIANTSFTKIMAIAGHYGFTPASATRIRAGSGDGIPVDEEFGF